MTLSFIFMCSASILEPFSHPIRYAMMIPDFETASATTFSVPVHRRKRVCAGASLSSSPSTASCPRTISLFPSWTKTSPQEKVKHENFMVTDSTTVACRRKGSLPFVPVHKNSLSFIFRSPWITLAPEGASACSSLWLVSGQGQDHFSHTDLSWVVPECIVWTFPLSECSVNCQHWGLPFCGRTYDIAYLFWIFQWKDERLFPFLM